VQPKRLKLVKEEPPGDLISPHTAEDSGLRHLDADVDERRCDPVRQVLEVVAGFLALPSPGVQVVDLIDDDQRRAGFPKRAAYRVGDLDPILARRVGQADKARDLLRQHLRGRPGWNADVDDWDEAPLQRLRRGATLSSNLMRLAELGCRASGKCQ